MIYILFMAFAIVYYFILGLRAYDAGVISNDIEFGNYVKIRKIYCVTCGTLLFLIAALRSPEVGSDAIRYVGYYFPKAMLLDWRAILSQDDVGFYILCKLLSLFTSNGQWLLVFCGFIFAFAISHFIFKNSQDMMVSYIMIIPLQFFAFSLTGLRQIIAMSIMILNFENVKNKHLIRFMLFTFAASLFHTSAIVAVPIYFLYRINIGGLKRFCMFILIPIIYIYKRKLLSFFQSWFYSDYSIYEQNRGSWATFAFYFLIWVLYLLLYYKDYSNCRPENSSGYDLKINHINVEPIYIVGFIVQLFVFVNPNVFRVAFYYQIFAIIMVPQLLTSDFFKNTKYIPQAVFVALMFIMYACFTYTSSGANPYYFFWQ